MHDNKNTEIKNMMNEAVYVRLRKFMDKLPGGYPETPTGVEIKILKKRFTPEDAELTMTLMREPETASAIAKRLGVEETALAERLEDLAGRGLIFRVQSGEKTLYHALQFMIGWWESNLKNLDREICEFYEEYMPYYGASAVSIPTRSARVIPVESSVGTDANVSSYNKVRELVKKQKVFSVMDCICRKEFELLGAPCEKPVEVCMAFGDSARYYIDNHVAREITLDECLKVVERAEEAGLVSLITNAQEDLRYLCCCCTCCCVGLKAAKRLPRPQELMKTFYESRIDSDLCTTCGACIERCPMDAIQEAEDVAEVIDGRCIGCGLCVSVCPVEAITMVALPGIEAPPIKLSETLDRMVSERINLAERKRTIL